MANTILPEITHSRYIAIQSPTRDTNRASLWGIRAKTETYVRQFTKVSLDQRNYPHERLSHRRPTCEEY